MKNNPYNPAPELSWKFGSLLLKNATYTIKFFETRLILSKNFNSG